MSADAKKLSLFAASLLILLSLSSSDDAKDKQECASSLVGLATCLPYVGGTARSPTPDCCNGLRQVLKTNKKCLCVVIKDRNDPDLGLNINVTLALGLPIVCNAPANVSQCPALLNLPPNSPEAQVFYQLGSNNSTHNNAVSPVAGGPNPTEMPSPNTSAPTGSNQNSNGCDKGKRLIDDMKIVYSIIILLFCCMYVNIP